MQAVKLMAEMKDAKKTFASDKSAQPPHRFVQTDVLKRIISPKFRVKKL